MAFESRFEEFANVAKGVVDKISVSLLDLDQVEIQCYVAHECDDDSEIDDVFQALIDISCVHLAKTRDTPIAVEIQILFPGSASFDDMYEPGDRASVAYNVATHRIDVLIYRAHSPSSKPVAYAYDV